uniref:Transmembrane protein n=1 Tax=Macrostomum lignano TaxID=282301 RepID=A0A1I8FPI5_9PLAT
CKSSVNLRDELANSLDFSNSSTRHCHSGETERRFRYIAAQKLARRRLVIASCSLSSLHDRRALVSVLMIWIVTAVLVYMAVHRVVQKDFEVEGRTLAAVSGHNHAHNNMNVRNAAPSYTLLATYCKALRLLSFTIDRDYKLADPDMHVRILAAMHSLRVWSLTLGRNVASAHLVVNGVHPMRSVVHGDNLVVKATEAI